MVDAERELSGRNEFAPRNARGRCVDRAPGVARRGDSARLFLRRRVLPLDGIDALREPNGDILFADAHDRRSTRALLLRRTDRREEAASVQRLKQSIKNAHRVVRAVERNIDVECCSRRHEVALRVWLRSAERGHRPGDQRMRLGDHVRDSNLVFLQGFQTSPVGNRSGRRFLNVGRSSWPAHNELAFHRGG